MSGFYLNPHLSQYGSNRSQITRTSGCTWTGAANGADASTGGRIHPTPDEVHAKVANSEETAPATPGWSLGDAKKAMDRLGVPFEIRSGQGWAGVVAALDSGHAVLLQGDSDRFPNGTCSGAFDGNHAILVHPDRNAAGRRIDDPICPSARYESEDILRAYAEKLSSGVLFGVFTDPVPRLDATVTILDAYDPPRTFTVAAGSTVNGYDPARPGAPVKSMAFAGASSARASARVQISWDPGPGPIPRGTFYRVADGAFAGLYVTEGSVFLAPAPEPTTPEPAPEPDCSEAVAKARAASLAKVDHEIAAEKAHIERLKEAAGEMPSSTAVPKYLRDREAALAALVSVRKSIEEEA